MPRYQLLTISSADLSSGTDGNYVLNLPSSAQVYKAKSVKLQGVQLPTTMYIINSGNNSIDFKDTGGTTRAVTITPGNYTATTLIAAVLTALNSVGPADFTTVTYSSTTMKVTVSNSGSFSLLFGTGTNVDTSIGPLLGYAVADTASATSAVASNVIQLYTPLNLYITVSEFGTPNANSKGNKYTFSIPISVNSGGVQEIDNNQDYDQTIDIDSPQAINKLSVIMRHRNNNIVDLNGGHWEMTLKFWF